MVVVRAKQLSATQDLLSQAKDSQLALDLREKDKKIAEAQREAAAADARAVEAKLQLEELKTPRTPGKDAYAKVLAKLKRFKGTPYDLFSSGEQESIALMELIDSLLHEAGWTFTAPEPNSMIFDGKAALISHSGVGIEIPEEQNVKFNPPAIALSTALEKEKIDSGARALRDDSRRKVLHVMVGSKVLKP
jgi:hypothetical protein